jgi:hypothetical protein
VNLPVSVDNFTGVAVSLELRQKLTTAIKTAAAAVVRRVGMVILDTRKKMRGGVIATLVINGSFKSIASSKRLFDEILAANMISSHVMENRTHEPTCHRDLLDPLHLDDKLRRSVLHSLPLERSLTHAFSIFKTAISQRF